MTNSAADEARAKLALAYIESGEAPRPKVKALCRCRPSGVVVGALYEFDDGSAWIWCGSGMRFAPSRKVDLLRRSGGFVADGVDFERPEPSEVWSADVEMVGYLRPECPICRTLCGVSGRSLVNAWKDGARTVVVDHLDLNGRNARKV